MEKATGYRLKVVEEGGEKVVDILHSSNPWRGEDCGRERCLLCATKQMTGQGLGQDCTKRSLVYETWCNTCKVEEEEAIDLEDIEEEEKAAKKRNIKVHKYIGETARSSYERGAEHQAALEKLDEDSHMLKHIISKHRDRDMEEVKFGMRVVRFTRSALERQVFESVMIQEERRESHIMNSKSEYSRCTLPRLTAKMGEEEYDKKRNEEKREEKKQEETVRKEIARIRKERCKKRSAEIHEYRDEKDNTRNKKRRIDEEGQYKVVVQMKKMIREKEETEDAGKGAKKIRKETPAPVKFLGGEWKDMELEEEVDWQKRREEIIRRLEQEEEIRIQKIEKAKRLSKGWEMMRECRRIIGENSTKWKTLKERIEEVETEESRQRQLEKAEAKKRNTRRK